MCKAEGTLRVVADPAVATPFPTFRIKTAESVGNHIEKDVERLDSSFLSRTDKIIIILVTLDN